MAYCGIDIGTENMCLSFITEDDQVVCYKGKNNNKACYLVRYAYEEEPTVLSVAVTSKSDYYHNICYMLALVPEFKNTIRVFVELQVSMHHACILKIEGAIIGYLLGRYPSVQVESCSSQKRTSFAKKYVEVHGTPDVRLYGVVRNTKTETMYMAASLYPEFYSFITQFCDKSLQWYVDKMDDICDTIVYAHMARVGKQA